MSTSSKPKGNYRAYLVRLWQDGPNAPWRALTRNVLTQDEQHFASVEELFVFLQDQTLTKNRSADPVSPPLTSD